MDKKIKKKGNETVAEMVTGMEKKVRKMNKKIPEKGNEALAETVTDIMDSSRSLMKERIRRIMGEIKAALKKSLNGLSPKASAKVRGSFREKEKDLKKAIKKWILKQP